MTQEMTIDILFDILEEHELLDDCWIYPSESWMPIIFVCPVTIYTMKSAKLFVVIRDET